MHFLSKLWVCLGVCLQTWTAAEEDCFTSFDNFKWCCCKGGGDCWPVNERKKTHTKCCTHLMENCDATGGAPTWMSLADPAPEKPKTSQKATPTPPPTPAGEGKAKGKKGKEKQTQKKGPDAPSVPPVQQKQEQKKEPPTTTTTTTTTKKPDAGSAKQKGKKGKPEQKKPEEKKPEQKKEQPAATEKPPQKKEEKKGASPSGPSKGITKRRPAVPLVELPGTTGVLMPISGLGMCCRPGASGPAATQAVMDYLALGGRHIDTAIVYGNHLEVAEGIRKSPDVAREEIFLVSKIPGDEFGFDPTWAAITRSLSELDTPFIDLMLLHWPGKAGKKAADDPSCVRETEDGIADWRLCRLGSWAALEQAHRKGLVKSIGVSNFGEAHLTEIMEAGTIRPSINQIEFHPWFQNRELAEFCHQHGIVITGYGTMGGSSMSEQIIAQDVLQEMGKQYGKTAGQVLLRWTVQSNVTVIPGTSNPTHMSENLDIFDFALTPEELKLLNEAGQQQEMHVYGHKPETIV